MLHFEIIKGNKADVEYIFAKLQDESGVQVIDWKFDTQISITGGLIFIIAVRYRRG